MTQLEMVEKLREMANISFEEAKQTLERNNWDMLDAVIELEKSGRTVKTTSSYSTNNYAPRDSTCDANIVPYRNCGDSGFKKVCKWILDLLKKSIVNKFEVSRDGESIMTIPVLLLIVLLFCAPYAVIIVLVIGLLFRFRYAFVGADLGRKEVNDVFDKAADYAENIRSYVSDKDDGGQKGNVNSNGDKDTHN